MISPCFLVSALLALALAACTATVPVQRNPLATWVPSHNFNARKPVIIVLHHTEQSSVKQSLKTLRTANSSGRGTITDLSSASIGIELDNNGLTPLTQAQITSLIALLRDLSTRLGVSSRHAIADAALGPKCNENSNRLHSGARDCGSRPDKFNGSNIF